MTLRSYLIYRCVRCRRKIDYQVSKKPTTKLSISGDILCPSCGHKAGTFNQYQSRNGMIRMVEFGGLVFFKQTFSD